MTDGHFDKQVSGGASNRQRAGKFVYIPTTTPLTKKPAHEKYPDLLPHFDEM